MSDPSPDVPRRPAALVPAADPTPVTAPSLRLADRGIPSRILDIRAEDRMHYWKQLLPLVPQPVREVILAVKRQALQDDHIPEPLPKAWAMRSSLLEALPLPSLQGLDWLFPPLPLLGWQEAYQASLRLAEWTSSPPDPRQDWRVLALTHRGPDDLVVEPARPKHLRLVVEPGPQTWLAWLATQKTSDPQPCLVMAATEETLMEGGIRRLCHLSSGQTLSATIAGSCLLLEDLEDEDQRQLCRLLHHQRRVLSEAPLPSGMET